MAEDYGKFLTDVHDNNVGSGGMEDSWPNRFDEMHELAQHLIKEVARDIGLPENAPRVSEKVKVNYDDILDEALSHALDAIGIRTVIQIDEESLELLKETLAKLKEE